MKKYFVTLYQIVKDTKTVRNKIPSGDIRTYHTCDQYRAFHIDAFVRDTSGRKLIGIYRDKFSEKEWTLRNIQVHLFCKKLADIGSFTSEDIVFEKLFPKRRGSNMLHRLWKDLVEYDRVILTENWEVGEFGVHADSEALRKAFKCRKFSALKDELPKDAFIVIDVEEPDFTNCL